MTDTTTDSLAVAMQRLTDHAANLGAPIILCLGCTGEYVQAATTGARGADLPPVNAAALIVAGNGMCLRHVQFAERPVMPGQTPSGLYLGTTGQAV